MSVRRARPAAALRHSGCGIICIGVRHVLRGRVSRSLPRAVLEGVWGHWQRYPVCGGIHRRAPAFCDVVGHVVGLPNGCVDEGPGRVETV